MPTSWQITSRIQSVANTWPQAAIAWCTKKDVVQVVRNGSGVSNRYNCKFSQNTLKFPCKGHASIYNQYTQADS